MENRPLLLRIQQLVEELFNKGNTTNLLYHDLRHTREVVKRAAEIAGAYKLDASNLFILLAAAWYHDTGHLQGSMEQHEETSTRIMYSFLEKEIADHLLKAIAGCIMATRLTASPVTLTEKILCDADTYHLGTPEFRQTDPLVWQELEVRTGKTFPDKDRKSLLFLQAHSFHTSYCRDLLSRGKQDNIEWLQHKISSHS
ncbi:MAG: HD domain-containing protein [Candidatus Pseudobacter hemicellulosilyticus]|uniref:HD domain-containing protein n=1 Tax=Candidatus Pseudobacter hemicellulosilyticus TaxID=3121375 RepID=A0AAJ5WWB6_9BACT|nr:MAG: HD domain-containing protein [Pseudobacter sp.]